MRRAILEFLIVLVYRNPTARYPQEV